MADGRGGAFRQLLILSAAESLLIRSSANALHSLTARLPYINLTASLASMVVRVRAAFDL